MKPTQYPNLAKVNKKPKVYILDIKEEAIHLAIAEYLDLVIKRPSRWHTTEVSNQASGFAAMRRQQILKKKGVRTGYPDITIIDTFVEDGLLINSMIFLEVKSAKGKLTPAQEALHVELREDGHECHVVRSVDDVKIILRALGVI